MLKACGCSPWISKAISIQLTADSLCLQLIGGRKGYIMYLPPQALKGNWTMEID